MRDGDNWVGIHIVLCFCFDSGLRLSLSEEGTKRRKKGKERASE